jgi:hypothetical protein
MEIYNFCQQDLICELHANRLTKDPKTLTQSKIVFEIISNKNLKPNPHFEFESTSHNTKLRIISTPRNQQSQKLDSTQNKMSFYS